MTPSVIDLAKVRREREGAQRAAGLISLRETDPENPNHSIYFIASKDADAVRAEIHYLITLVEQDGAPPGRGSFEGPFRFNGFYIAFGDVEVFP